MNRNTPERVLGVILFAIGTAVGSGCGNTDPVPDCFNCENWEQIVDALSRFPEPHPTSPDFVLYSTVAKQTGLDENRDADEDVWLAWHGTRDAATGKDRVYQLTGHVPAGGDSALSVGDNLGDNFSPRWSPSGTQVAFMHTTAGGTYEIWRMPVTIPSSPSDLPAIGNPVLVLADARDPAWESETRLLFTRDDKMYFIEIPVALDEQPSMPPVQISFDPPPYSSNESFVDRHPAFAAEGAADAQAVFGTRGRRNTASVYLEAFEIDNSGPVPDTTETNAYIAFAPPPPPGESYRPSYPILDSGDTLTTPTLLKSIAVDQGGAFQIGVRRDFRFLADSTAETYCDTTITQSIPLVPGQTDSVTYYFEISRGTLRFTSDFSGTRVFWARQDGRVTIDDFPGGDVISDPGSFLSFDCLLSYRVNADSTVNESLPYADYLVRGTRGALVHTATVKVPPDAVTTVTLFPSGSLSGVVSFSDSPPVLPRAGVAVIHTPSGETVARAFSSDVDGTFLLPRVPGDGDDPGSYEVHFDLVGYQSVVLDPVIITPGMDTNVGTIVMDPVGGARRDVFAARSASTSVLTPHATETPIAKIEERFLPAVRAVDNPGSVDLLFRAPGDVSTVWRLDLSDPDVPVLTELFGSQLGLAQHPALTQEFAGGVRYIAYIADDRDDWELYVQRLVNWVPDGGPIRIEAPGTIDNLSCIRNLFHPRWVPGTSPTGLELLVSMTDCPDNGFEELGPDDDPWALGELRVWKVTLGGL